MFSKLTERKLRQAEALKAFGDCLASDLPGTAEMRVSFPGPPDIERQEVVCTEQQDGSAVEIIEIATKYRHLMSDVADFAGKLGCDTCIHRPPPGASS